MQWSYDAKKADCTVKYIGWKPPWVAPTEPKEKRKAEWYLKDNLPCQDFVGHGRVPALWWTKNLAYNKAYEIHRLNAGAKSVKEAVSGGADGASSTRFDFARCSPDILVQMSALRTELDMRMVMPAIVPHTAEQPFLAMARAEESASGHPHYHGYVYAANNPQIHRIDEDDPTLAAVASSPSSSEAESQPEEGKSAEDVEQLPRPSDSVAGPESHDKASAKAEGKGKKPRAKRVRTLRIQRSTASVPDAENAGAVGESVKAEKRSDKEEEFWQYFKKLVFEWNPCFDDDGRFRYVWDEEVGAHDVHVLSEGGANSQPAESERTRLREVLDDVFRAAESGDPLDLEPLRKLVGRLVQSSGRHQEHGREGPKFTDPCAQGSKKCPVCRYGYPHELFCRECERKTHLEKGEKKDNWFLRFPRNDPYCNSYEPHFLLANLGNVDWRPCINLYAVVEYVTKYAMKAPKGSRRLGEVLKSAVDEVCRYGKEGQGLDLLQQSFKKVFARTLGDRDFTLFEAVHLGLGLPQVFEMLPTISLNTYGTRRLKHQSVLRKLGEDEDVREDSKVDKFNKRLAILRDQNRGKKHVAITEAELRDVSFYEFYWKYYVKYNRIYRSNRPVALMVTPSVSADCANVTHARHEMYARTSVVAYWRLMAKDARHQLHKDVAGDERLKRKDELVLGHTPFATPWLDRRGQFDVGRFLGIGDLIEAFEGKWGEALMEMLVDPVLSEWVPLYVVQQYDRWNPFFRKCLQKGLERGSEAETNARREDLKKELMEEGFPEEEAARQANELKSYTQLKSNMKLLAYVKRQMVKMHEKALLEEKRRGAADDGDDGEGDGGSTAGGDGSDPDEDPEVAAAKALDGDAGADVQLIRDELPSFDLGAGHMDDGGVGDWSGMTLDQKASAAGPAKAAEDIFIGNRPGVSMQMDSAADASGAVNPSSFDWSSTNVASLERAKEWENLWGEWRNSAVDEDADAPGRSELDVWQRFLFDIMDQKARDWEKAKREGTLKKYQPARVIGAGTAGTGKSRTTRAIVKRRREMARLAGFLEAEVRGNCVLAAPTGCASFHISFGATTAHRVYGVNPKRPFARLKQDSAQYKRLQKLHRLARLLILDERSMIGRAFLGKIAFRLQELLGCGEGPSDATMGFRDFLMMGDDKQCDPIGDSPLFNDGKYSGDAKHVEGGPRPEALVGMGLSIRNECEDVVILRDVWRLDDGDESMGVAERQAYRAEADEFVRVCRRLADCEMTRADHAWLSRRNRSVLLSTEEGRREYAKFKDAIMLMDGRKRNAEGKDGADQVNASELRRIARERQVPIASFGALHYDYEEGSDPNVVGADDFSGLASHMELCVGARVLLTNNLWVQAGLMNGAMGTVRGFVWPKGAEPGSKEKKLSAPLFVVVEFDDVRLKGVHGEERTFFPGEPDKQKWVPIPMSSATSTMDETMSRHQFPLVLAWAITHWKAQGMTLAQARVRLGTKCAAMHGVGFVALTRVRHPTHMVFEEDLPDWEVFQGVRETATFHRRRRFELRLEARASRTIRKYSFCEASGEQWSRADASRAARLLSKLEVKREEQRGSLKNTGRRTHLPSGEVDVDAFLWDGEPNYRSFLYTAADELEASEIAADGEVNSYRRVADRLLAATTVNDGTEVFVHLPAVQEALGALIPEWLHPSQDDPKKRGKKRGLDVNRIGVFLKAHGWQLSVFAGEALQEHKPVAADTMEFFSVLARHVCKELGLPIAIGSIGLGARLTQSVVRDERCDRLIRSLKGFASWDRSEVMNAEEFLVPHPVADGKQCRDWGLLRVSSAVKGEKLGRASKLHVCVVERGLRITLGKRIGHKLLAVLRGDTNVSLNDVEAVREAYPAETTSFDTTLAITGLIWAHVSAAAEISHLDPASPTFLVDSRSCLFAAFRRLRLEADARGDCKVEKSLRDRDACLDFLRILGKRDEACDPPPDVTRETRRANVPIPEEDRLLKVLTWNVAGRDLSDSAPKSWNVRDKFCALRREIFRLQPDVLALQEVPGSGVCDAVPEGLTLVGSAEAHPRGCYAQLYCRPSLAARLVRLPSSSPAVAAVCCVNGCDVTFVSAHLTPSKDGESDRAREMRQIVSECAASSLVVMGDLNVRRPEVKELCDLHDLRDMPYSGCTWDP